LANLEELALSGNQLSGCIPAQLKGVDTDTSGGDVPFCSDEN